MRRINLDALPLDGIEGLFEFRFAATIARLADEQQNFSAAALAQVIGGGGNGIEHARLAAGLGFEILYSGADLVVIAREILQPADAAVVGDDGHFAASADDQRLEHAPDAADADQCRL